MPFFVIVRVHICKYNDNVSLWRSILPFVVIGTTWGITVVLVFLAFFSISPLLTLAAREWLAGLPNGRDWFVALLSLLSGLCAGVTASWVGIKIERKPEIRQIQHLLGLMLFVGLMSKAVPWPSSENLFKGPSDVALEVSLYLGSLLGFAIVLYISNRHRPPAHTHP